MPRVKNPSGYGKRITTHSFLSGRKAIKKSEPVPLMIGTLFPSLTSTQL
jgi:hypothetical protein